MRRGFRLLVSVATLAVGLVFILWGVWAMIFAPNTLLPATVLALLGLVMTLLALQGFGWRRFANRNTNPS